MISSSNDSIAVTNILSFPIGLLGVLLKINVPVRNETEIQRSQTGAEFSGFNEEMNSNNTAFNSASHEITDDMVGDIQHQFNELNTSNEWVQFDQDNSDQSSFNTETQTKNIQQLQVNDIQSVERDEPFRTSFADINSNDGQNERLHKTKNSNDNNRLSIQTPQRKPKSVKDTTAIDRPPTPSMKQRMNNEMDVKNKTSKKIDSSINHEFVVSKHSSNPIKIDVKPLPKIRLDLMPSPREADEEFEDEW